MKVLIYGKTACPFCDKAKMLCQTKNITYEYYLIGQDYTKEYLEELVGSPVRSVPQIFKVHDNSETVEYIGGFTEFDNMLKSQLI